MPLVMVSGYLWLPIGCCVKNPMPNAVLYDESDGDLFNRNYIDRTVGAGVLGTLGTLYGCATCCGCFGTYSPRESL